MKFIVDRFSCQRYSPKHVRVEFFYHKNWFFKMLVFAVCLDSDIESDRAPPDFARMIEKIVAKDARICGDFLLIPQIIIFSNVFFHEITISKRNEFLIKICSNFDKIFSSRYFIDNVKLTVISARYRPNSLTVGNADQPRYPARKLGYGETRNPLTRWVLKFFELNIVCIYVGRLKHDY